MAGSGVSALGGRARRVWTLRALQRLWMPRQVDAPSAVNHFTEHINSSTSLHCLTLPLHCVKFTTPFISSNAHVSSNFFACLFVC